MLAKLGDTTVLGLLISRTLRARSLDQVIVATTTLPEDDEVAVVANSLGAGVVRGPVDDVLARYEQAVRASDASIVVRLTGDCPLCDPILIDHAIDVIASGSADLVSNGSARYLRGFDVEAMTRSAILAAADEAALPHERAHVTAWLYANPDRFDVRILDWPRDHGHLRLTVDTPEDLDVVRTVVGRLVNPLEATWEEVVLVLEADPELGRRNATVRQKDPREG